MKRSSPVDIHDAMADFARLIDQAAMGSEVVIARAGKSVAKLVPFVAARRERKAVPPRQDSHVVRFRRRVATGRVIWSAPMGD
jgi:antitoxin (DNA-binding transcriptional repressor) of toxin-antitoxin stability system